MTIHDDHRDVVARIAQGRLDTESEAALQVGLRVVPPMTVAVGVQARPARTVTDADLDERRTRPRGEA
ncbi:hypothetical protein [Krasilnikoviella flava]|uniref:Uncharacterized protein n=1 Tax=Krasilnikoviella flava TaxID=526729 RepID=A0A1T5L8Y7_9MICO|nr:hypothetical protein [Krasilnikoviella flava]SKC71858.1 hypothetical protein SAMN04324258_3062 [Krasilnikoviella flava]